MTPRTLFTIILKVMGISILIDALAVISQSIATGISVGRGFTEDNFINILIALGLVLFVVAVYCLAIWIFLFRTDYIIDKLSLDKHFREERFEINIHRSTVVPIAIIVVGGLIIVEALPTFCKQTFLYIQQKKNWGQGFDNPIWAG